MQAWFYYQHFTTGLMILKPSFSTYIPYIKNIPTEAKHVPSDDHQVPNGTILIDNMMAEWRQRIVLQDEITVRITLWVLAFGEGGGVVEKKRERERAVGEW